MLSSAKTTNFMLGVAEVMLGAEASLFSLGPAHSLGLVKEFSLSLAPASVGLPRGVRAMPSKIVRKSNDLQASMQLYEFTAKNLLYAAGLNGAATGVTPAKTSLSTQALAASSIISVFDVAGFTNTDTIIISDGVDQFISRRITAISGTDITLNRALNFDFPASSSVILSTPMDLASGYTPPSFSARVLSRLADGTPLELLFPKVVVTSDFALLAAEQDYGSIPLEFLCLESRSGDPHFSEFGNEPGRLIIGSQNDSKVVHGLGTVFWDNFSTWDNLTLWI